MFCTICGKECTSAEEQFKHEKEHSVEDKDRFQQEQDRRRQEFESQQQNRQELPVHTTYTRGPNYSKIYATEWGLNLTELDIRIDIYNERLNHRPMRDPLDPFGKPFQPVEFIIESQIITPIISAKTLHIRLGEIIAHYEKENGELPVRMQ